MAPDSVVEQLNSVTKPVLDYLTAFTRNFQNFFQQMIAEHEAAAEVHPRVLEVLLSRGWCHSYDFPDRALILLSNLADAGEYEQIDKAMADFTRYRFDRIMENACTAYPERANILTDAFEAHRAGKYTLSIPTLLAQVDGIGCEVLGLERDFFHKEERKKSLKTTISQLKVPGMDKPFAISSIHERMQLALKLDWNLTVKTNKRSADLPRLNRHGVLHGLDTDYPTEMNSLRCVLLIGFLLETRKVLREEFPKEIAEMSAAMEGVPPDEGDGRQA